MLCIGLTGGIGSGKSTVASIFEVLNVPVLYADDIAKNLMVTDVELRKSIIDAFGSKAYNNGGLNKDFISTLVFNDKDKLKVLNALVHPATIRYTQRWVSSLQAPYIIKEAALLFESNSDMQTDYVIGVKAALETRISRAMKRSNISRDAVLKRISNQMDEDEKLSKCDYIINNENDTPLIPQVLQIHNLFLKLSINKTR